MSQKNFRVRVAEGVLSATLFFAAGVCAQPAKDDFQQGVDEAAAGHYDQAVTHFLQAKKTGSDRPALDYNLGVAYFKLGRYQAARESFLRLADKPGFEQLAYFNLGLTANKTNDEKAAVGWFQRAYAGNDADLKSLSAQALQRLGTQPRLPASRRKPWSGFVATVLGHDSNVTLVNDDLTGATRESDNTFEVLASIDHWLRGTPKDGLQFSLSADAQMYEQNSQYDFSFLHAGFSRYGQLGNWRTDFGLSMDEIYFDGLPYQRALHAEANGRLTLSKEKELRVRYRLSRIRATDSDYDYLDGWRQQWRAGLWMRSGERRYKAYYQLEVNDRNDLSFGNDFRSYSPTRHTLLAAVAVPVATKWSVGADVRYRNSRYNEANVYVYEIDPDPAVPPDIPPITITKTREDKQYRLGVQVTYAFIKNWEFEAGYSYTDNNSNLTNYSYTRSLVTAGLNWFF